MKTTEVTLLKLHEHAGRKYPAGAKIEVRLPTADWLIKHQIAKAGGAKPEEK